MKVLVIGGGIAGLTTALCCAERGMHVVIFEQASEFKEVGAGLQLSPNGTRVLYKLGLQTQLEDLAFRPKSLDMKLGHSGKNVFSIPLTDTETKYGSPYLHIHRADLLSILEKEVKNSSKCEIYTDHKVVELVENGESASITCSNGAVYNGDVVVGADGIHSIVREHIVGKNTARFTGNLAWRAVIPTKDLPKDLIPPSATVWTGDKRHAVTYYLRSGELVNFVGVVEQESWQKESWTERGNPQDLIQDFSSFAPEIRTLTQSIDSCFKWALHDRMPLKTWTNGRLVVLGDAAHPMLPFLAQGAVMGIEDAEILAACLENYSWSEALKTFEKIRKPRTSRVQAGARANMNLFHHGQPISRLIHYKPIQIAARLFPNFINNRQDWLYKYKAENPN